jgi:hypothetical protein
MTSAANGCSRALSNLKVPFLSCFMGGVDSGYDMRDTEHQGTKYNGSGCLIHGLAVVADSLYAVEKMLSEHPEYAAADFSLGDLQSTGGTLTLYPNAEHDGFFISMLTKR